MFFALLLGVFILFVDFHEFSAQQARFFRANAHQMTFYRRGKRSLARCFSLYHIVQVLHEEDVPAAVAIAVIAQLLRFDLFLIHFVESADRDRMRFLVQHDLAERAVEGVSSATAVRERRHQKGSFDAVCKGHLRKLVIDYVVIATIYATPVRSFLDRLLQFCLGREIER